MLGVLSLCFPGEWLPEFLLWLASLSQPLPAHAGRVSSLPARREGCATSFLLLVGCSGVKDQEKDGRFVATSSVFRRRFSLHTAGYVF